MQSRVGEDIKINKLYYVHRWTVCCSYSIKLAKCKYGFDVQQCMTEMKYNAYRFNSDNAAYKTEIDRAHNSRRLLDRLLHF